VRFDIRAASPAQYDNIDAIERAAFGRDDEALLVRRLRQDRDVIVELVAAADAGIVGHILFARLPIDAPSGTMNAVALAPLAVLPPFQSRGIGAALVQRGLDACRDAGSVAVIVVGDPAYYSRFGFSAAMTENLRSPYAGPACMGLELTNGALTQGGTVRYATAFSGI
jgi:putative acetyltransferase